MKPLLFAVTLAFFFFGCQRDQAEVSQPSPAEQAVLHSLGSSAAGMLMTNLQSALLDAISSGGPANGISVCSDTAQQLTNAINRQLGDGIRVRRTTTKLRNPANAPDQFEQMALQHFSETAGRTDSLPGSYMQKISVNNTTFYRFYKPMQVGGLCLNCHGQLSGISDSVKTVLQRHYPDDQATGYKAGDFRGVVSVTVERNL